MLYEVITLDDDVAGQHGPDLVLLLKRLEGEIRITGSENRIGAEIGVDFFLQRRLDLRARYFAYGRALRAGRADLV